MDGYAMEDPANQLALLLLDEPVQGITPVALPAQDESAPVPPGTLLTVLGWTYASPQDYFDTDELTKAGSEEEQGVLAVVYMQCRAGRRAEPPRCWLPPVQAHMKLVGSGSGWVLSVGEAGARLRGSLLCYLGALLRWQCAPVLTGLPLHAVAHPVAAPGRSRGICLADYGGPLLACNLTEPCVQLGISTDVQCNPKRGPGSFVNVAFYKVSTCSRARRPHISAAGAQRCACPSHRLFLARLPADRRHVSACLPPVQRWITMGIEVLLGKAMNNGEYNMFTR